MHAKRLDQLIEPTAVNRGVIVQQENKLTTAGINRPVARPEEPEVFLMRYHCNTIDPGENI